MKLPLIFLIALCLILPAYAGKEDPIGSARGKVTDAVSKEAIPFATVLLTGTSTGTTTNENGIFEISGLLPGTYQLTVSAVGYQSVTVTDVTVSGSKPALLDIQLRETVFELEGVVVKADYFSRNTAELSSVSSFGYEEIRRAPGGFEDVVRALSVLPGVAQADAGRNDLIVRGGAPSENLYLLDGIEIPNINHFGTQGATGGPLSYINLDYVNETSFSSGAFPVMYGDKLSSVLRINLRDGRTDRLGGKATISASQFGLNLEGPVSDKSNFIFSARRSYLDFIFKAAGFGFVPEYYDVLSKYNFTIDKNSSLSYIFIAAFDRVKYFNDTPDKRYDNSRVLGSNQNQYMTGITYRRLVKNGFYQLTLSRTFTDYDTRQNDSLLNPLFLNISREGENRLKFEYTLEATKNSQFNAGADLRLVRFKADAKIPFFKTTFGEVLPVNSLSVADNFIKSGVFVNWTQMFSEKFTANAGARADYFDAIDNKFTVAPRVSAVYNLSPITSVSFSTGLYYQTPSYIWLAGDSKNRGLKPLRVDQYVAAFDHRLQDDAVLKIEAYQKNYSDYTVSLLRPYLTLANTGAGFAGSEDNFAAFGFEPLASLGSGFARGIELSLQKKLSETPYYGIISLTFNETKLKALDGVARPGTYDQRWIANISGGYKISESWEAALKFRFATGRPYTPYNADGTQSVARYNSQRYEPLHSLDLRVDKRWFFDRLTLITYLDLQNVYNNKGGSIRWDAREKKQIFDESIGLLPSIGVSLEF